MKLPRASDAGSIPLKQTTVVSRHDEYSIGETTGGLSVLFTVLCIVDLFGVFPVVTLPKSIISCGIYGVPLVIFVFGLQLYTAVLLGRSWLLAQELTPRIREKIRYPYAAVAELAFGQPSRRMVTFLIDATVFGAGIPNFILASQSLQLFWWKISDGEIGVTYCVWMLVIALLLCPVLWLGSPKDMKPLAVMSVLIVTTVAVSTWSCILTDDTSPPSTSSVFAIQPSMQDFLIAYGIIAFQFDIHPLLLTIQVDMKDSRKINTAVVGGFLVTSFMFAVTTILAANRYGEDVDNNILQGMNINISKAQNKVFASNMKIKLSFEARQISTNQNDLGITSSGDPPIPMRLTVLLQVSMGDGNHLPSGIPPSVTLFVVALLVTLQLCLSSAVGNNALFQHIEDLLNIPREFCMRRCLVRSGIVALAVFLAESVPRFDLVMGLVGSTLTGPLMFIFPPLFFLKLCYMKSQIKNGSNNNQNGANYPLIFEDALETKYKTFSYSRIGGDLDAYNIKWYDLVLAVLVMTMGVTATLVATYSSWSDTISFATYSPPCLVNATIAARSFLQAQTS
ncbi:unnamed protein product [Diatraea saccharalis]|uniref:Amino acid transporter transmembrane domain-containing protein n=1 Tax=Diatraea saccharalis TaxID=40085 RepID=A0A9N9WHC0_9NEOP|nr:unnamed protein product [Diatraea saccharalis]